MTSRAREGWRAAVLLALFLGTSCRAATPSAPHDETAIPRSRTPTVPATAAPGAAPTRTEESLEPVVVVSSPATLRALEERGLDLGSELVGSPARTASELSAHARYRVLSGAVASDLAQDRRRDRSAGVGMRYAHRQFDARWLSSAAVRFELIAIVNRLDRRPFAPEHCGELRFVYRLAYAVHVRAGTVPGPAAATTDDLVDSRLPMTVNLVRYQANDGQGCARVAQSWLGKKGASEDLAWLTGEHGPLARARLEAAPLKSVELNYQSVRWPSTVRPSLAGHAEYVLRVFHPADTAPFLKPALLENTVDPERLRADPRLRAALADWLKQPAALSELDRGTLQVPDEYLAERARSVSPHGFERLANRPYTRAFSARDFEGVSFGESPSVRSAASMLRRLDGLSCPGCHQSRSLAGFHVLGEDAANKAVDALHVPMSPHFHAEVWRRGAYVATLARGETPDEMRPPGERAPLDHGVGAHCGLGGAAFASWTCATGLRCVNTGDPEVGTCLPEAGPSVGDACEYGAIAQADAHRDSARLQRTECQDGRVCEANAVGFPDGMCAGSCAALPEGAVCGGIALLTEFNTCLAAGQPFERCVLENTRPGALRACSFHEPCRDDYVCARAPGGGACMPPYFLFQLRVDGHPL